MSTGKNQLSLFVVVVSFAVTLSACGGSGRGMVSAVDPTPMPPMDGDAAMALTRVLADSNSPAIAQFGAKPPPPDGVMCLALIIGCEGGPGPIHYGSVGELDFAGFSNSERRRGVSLTERTRASGEGGAMTDHRALAGWLSHSLFFVETPGSGKNLRDRYYRAYSTGNASGSDPGVLVGSAATWTGVMLGVRVADPDVLLQGDALITVSNPAGDAALLVDVEFTNIHDEETGAGLDDISWNGLELKDGAFGVVPVSAGESDISRHPASHGITGRFYGSNHEEVGGLFSFVKSVPGDSETGVSGAFGAKLD